MASSSRPPAGDGHRDSDSDSSGPEIKLEEPFSDSDASEDNDAATHHSADELQLLSLDHKDDASAANSRTKDDKRVAAPAPGSVPAADGVLVKRVVRRKRKRMSADERRVRHREVQRQFMKRKRARLGEMRKVLRSVESQHRLVQVMNERVALETQNAELTERLAGQGSGWQWGDEAASESKSEQQQTTEPHVVQFVQSNGLMVFQHVPSPLGHPQMMVQSHPSAHYPISPLEHYPTQYLHPHHLQYQHPPVHDASHSLSHRASASGMPLPWDDILDAVAGEAVSGASHDFSF